MQARTGSIDHWDLPLHYCSCLSHQMSPATYALSTVIFSLQLDFVRCSQIFSALIRTTYPIPATKLITWNEP